jgi:hypothetical protein
MHATRNSWRSPTSFIRIALCVIGLAFAGLFLFKIKPDPIATNSSVKAPQEEQADERTEIFWPTPEHAVGLFKGEWRSIHGDGSLLSIQERLITLSRGKKVIFYAGYDPNSSFTPDLAVWLATEHGDPMMSGWLSRPFDWLVGYDVVEGELLLSGICGFTEFMSSSMGIKRPHDRILRFRPNDSVN